MLSIDQDLVQCARDIEAALDALLRTSALGDPDVPPTRLLNAMRHGAMGGGKRLRPLLVRETAAVFGIGPAASLQAGLAVELIHCYSLIHDDLPAMDDDDLRRGRPTVHKAYDDATAILAGDALLTEAFRVLSRSASHPDAQVRVQLVAELAAGAGAGGMVGGQMRDIEGEAGGFDHNAISRMQAQKTGALIRAAVRMGAVLGGADASDLGALTRYGEAAGRAFQLADDVLDATASTEALGKAAGKDQDRNKQTLVSLLGLDTARRQLDATIAEAQDALVPFGPRAGRLAAIASYFGSRSN